jgi:hypothetical protein
MVGMNAASTREHVGAASCMEGHLAAFCSRSYSLWPSITDSIQIVAKLNVVLNRGQAQHPLMLPERLDCLRLNACVER